MELLIVEDDDQLRKAIRRELISWGAKVVSVGCLKDAKSKLDRFYDLIILDVNLPDGSGVELVETINKMDRIPHIVAITGEATRTECYSLGQLGVIGFINKPFNLTDFGVKLISILEKPTEVNAQISNVVGQVDYIRFIKKVRCIMLTKALYLSAFNITKTAKLLGVSRQAVQQMITEFEINISKLKN